VRGYTAKVGLRKPEPVDVPYSWGGEVLDDEPIPHAADGGYVLTPEFAQLVGSPLLSALNEGFNDIERTRRTSAYDAGGLLPVVSQTFNASNEPEPIVKAAQESYDRMVRDLRGGAVTGWCYLTNHPDIPEQHYDEDGETTEDFVDYLGRVDEFLEQHPPVAPDGFWLIPCDAEPRHYPLYTPVFSDVYEPTCPICWYDAERKAHSGCEHARHGRWRRWKATSKVVYWLTRCGLISGSSWRGGGGCPGCITDIRWRWSR